MRGNCDLDCGAIKENLMVMKSTWTPIARSMDHLREYNVKCTPPISSHIYIAWQTQTRDWCHPLAELVCGNKHFHSGHLLSLSFQGLFPCRTALVTPFDAAARLNDVVCHADSQPHGCGIASSARKVRGAADCERIVHILLDQIPTPLDGFSVDNVTLTR